ncbi:MAG: peptidylprolyl isomerase [Oscillospiraceae bacterium]|nr:peptidylprolyl isomerase [Oscillospiraceae bacterium]
MRNKITAAALSLALFALLSAGCGSVSIAIKDYDYGEMRLVQLEELYEGQPVAVITTTLGVVKVALYPQYAPNTVGNFIERAEEGYYDGKKVLVIFNQLYFLSGVDNEEAGEGGKTTDGKPIVNEYSVNLWPFKGALLSCGDRQGEGDSRFFIVNSDEFGEAEVEALREVKKDGKQMFPDEFLYAFAEKGGVFEFSGRYTVYGQTVEGIDVVEAICAAEVDETTRKPVTDIVIEKIELEYYTEE